MSREPNADTDNNALPRKVFFRPEMSDEEIDRLPEQMYENAGLAADVVKTLRKDCAAETRR